MPGLVINNDQYEIEGLDIANFFDNPKMKLSREQSYRLRTKAELRNVISIIVHTTLGIPGGKNLTPQTVRPGDGKSTNAGIHYAQMWAGDKTRKAGSQLVVDVDGKIYCMCDLLLHAAYHCGAGNGNSIGIEMKQLSDGSLYQATIDSTVALVDALCYIEPFKIERRVRSNYSGPALCLNGRIDISGVWGHRDLTNNRGAGDPGDFIFDALIDYGFDTIDLD